MAIKESRKALNTIDDRATIYTDPLRNFRFRVAFKAAKGAGKPFDDRIRQFSGGFSGIGGLSQTIEAVEYREGGYNTTMHKMPGLTKFEPLTLSRGALFGNDSAMTWLRGLFTVSSGEGFAVKDSGNLSYRCNVTIQVMDHPNSGDKKNTPRLGFYVQNAWISGLRYSDLNAGGGDSQGLMLETMTLQHEGLTAVYLKPDGTGYSLKKPAGF